MERSQFDYIQHDYVYVNKVEYFKDDVEFETLMLYNIIP